MTLNFLKLSVTKLTSFNLLKLSVVNLATLNFRKLSDVNLATLNSRKLSDVNLATLNFKKLSDTNLAITFANLFHALENQTTMLYSGLQEYKVLHLPLSPHPTFKNQSSAN